jgi:hypothetical protein
VSELPEFTETETNDTVETANVVEVPVAINGRIGSPKDEDTFKFKSQKDQHLVCEIKAQQLGSPLDALLTLKDSKGSILARNDDAAGMDARIDYDKFAKDQEYFLSVRDLNERGGDKFAYRLLIHLPVQDFGVKFFPDIPRLNRGGRGTIRCEVSRFGGFNGAVRVALEGLPPGVSSEPLVLTESPGTGMILISAAPDAPTGNFPIRLMATATLNGKPVTRLSEPVIPGQRPRRAKSGSRAGDDRPLNDAILSILDTPQFFLDAISLVAEADQDQGATVEVRAQRMDGFTNEIELFAEGFSTDREPITKNFDVPSVSIKANESTAKLVLNAKAGAEVGTRTIVIRGRAAFNGQTNVQCTQSIPLTVRQIPFTLASSLPRLSLTALPPGANSAAGEAVFSVKAERRAGFNGEIPLTLEGLPEGVVAAFDKIPANQNEASVKLTATPKAPVGKEINFTFQGVGMFNDRSYKQRTPPIKLTVSAPEDGLSSAR